MAAHLTPEQQATALDLQRKLWTQGRIALEIGVHQATVSRFLARHNRRILKRIEKQTAAIKAQQVHQLEWMAEEAATQWTRSTEDVETIKTSTTTVTSISAEGVATLPGEKTDRTVKGQSGNPALLREARETLAEIRTILGLDARDARETAKLNHILGQTGVPQIRDVMTEAEERADALKPARPPDAGGSTPGAAGPVP